MNYFAYAIFHHSFQLRSCRLFDFTLRKLRNTIRVLCITCINQLYVLLEGRCGITQFSDSFELQGGAESVYLSHVDKVSFDSIASHVLSNELACTLHFLVFSLTPNVLLCESLYRKTRNETISINQMYTCSQNNEGELLIAE